MNERDMVIWTFIIGLASVAAFGVLTLANDHAVQEVFCVSQGYKGRGNIVKITFEESIYVECIKHDIQNGNLVIIREYVQFKEAP